MATDLKTCVLSITTLEDRPNRDYALDLLQRTASLVKPIMKKNGWVLPEFYPENQTLLGLNLNKGEKIFLRLRPNDNPMAFYELEELVQVMLHELTHNIHSDHDDTFYDFLGKLQEEYWELKYAGYAGEGFQGPGYRLGVGPTQPTAQQTARARAVEAALKRQQAAKGKAKGKLGASARKLGGPWSSTTPRKAPPSQAAVSAAERRLRDGQTCGSAYQKAKLVKGETEKEALEGVARKAAGLTLNDGSPVNGPVGSSASGSKGKTIVTTPPAPQAVDPSTANTPNTSTSDKAKAVVATPLPRQGDGANVANIPVVLLTRWACQACTLVNRPTATECEACSTPRFFIAKGVQNNAAQDNPDGWNCLACGERGMKHIFWSCRFCGTIKSSSEH